MHLGMDPPIVYSLSNSQGARMDLWQVLVQSEDSAYVGRVTTACRKAQEMETATKIHAGKEL